MYFPLGCTSPKLEGTFLTVKLNWLMDVLLVLPWSVCYHFFMTVTDWGPTIRFRRQTLVKPPFRSWAEKHGIAWPFLVWEVPFGGKFGDDVAWPKKASQVASVGGSKRHFPWSLIKSSGFFLRDVWFLYLRCRLRDASSRPDFRCLKIFGNLKWKAERLELIMKTI